MSILSFLFAMLNLIFWNSDKYRLYIRIGLIIALGLSMPAFYTGVGPTVRSLNLPLNDEALLRIDNFLLGRFFPDGQLALAVDQNTNFGPTTFFGRLLTEILQLSYVSYYVWGPLLIIALSTQYITDAWMDHDQQRKDDSWRNVKMFLCAWLGTCVLNFAINLLVPALSPRLYIADRYTNPLDGFGLSAFFRRAIYIAGDGSYGTFPSAHTSVSWVTGLAAFKHFRHYGRVTIVAAMLITLATVYLRYHYVIDLLGAVPLVVFGMIYGGYLSYLDIETWLITQVLVAVSMVSFLFMRLTSTLPPSLTNSTEVNIVSQFLGCKSGRAKKYCTV
jgi:hypothetical protein